MKMNKHVKGWTLKNFKRSSPKSVDLSKKLKHLNGEVVSAVHKGSPAYFLGIKPGWILVSINDKTYDNHIVYMKKMLKKINGRNKF